MSSTRGDRQALLRDRLRSLQNSQRFGHIAGRPVSHRVHVIKRHPELNKDALREAGIAKVCVGGLKEGGPWYIHTFLKKNLLHHHPFTPTAHPLICSSFVFFVTTTTKRP